MNARIGEAVPASPGRPRPLQPDLSRNHLPGAQFAVSPDFLTRPGESIGLAPPGWLSVPPGPSHRSGSPGDTHGLRAPRCDSAAPPASLGNLVAPVATLGARPVVMATLCARVDAAKSCRGPGTPSSVSRPGAGAGWPVASELLGSPNPWRSPDACPPGLGGRRGLA